MPSDCPRMLGKGTLQTQRLCCPDGRFPKYGANRPAARRHMKGAPKQSVHRQEREVKRCISSETLRFTLYPGGIFRLTRGLFWRRGRPQACTLTPVRAGICIRETHAPGIPRMRKAGRALHTALRLRAGGQILHGKQHNADDAPTSARRAQGSRQNGPRSIQRRESRAQAQPRQSGSCGSAARLCAIAASVGTQFCISPRANWS